MSVQLWWALFSACVVISLTPGAGAINTMTNAINEGWRRSVWGVFGQQLGLIVQIAIAALGVGALVAASPTVLTVVRWVGAAYLVYLGLRLILAPPVPAPDLESRPRTSRWALFTRGLMVNLLNPKAVVFFLAFTPQFIAKEADPLPQYLIFGVTCVLVDMVVMWLGYAALARPLGRLMHTHRGQRILNSIFGSCFLLVAGLLLAMH